MPEHEENKDNGDESEAPASMAAMTMDEFLQSLVGQSPYARGCAVLELLPIARRLAKARQGRIQTDEPVPEILQELVDQRGEVFEQLAKIVGMGGRTLRKVLYLRDNADDELKGQLDTEAISIHAAYEKFTKPSSKAIASTTRPGRAFHGPYPAVIVDLGWPSARTSTAEERAAACDLVRGLELERVLAPEGFLLLWVTNGFLGDAVSILQGWGLRIYTVLTTTAKRNDGGYLLLDKTEHCLVAGPDLIDVPSIRKKLKPCESDTFIIRARGSEPAMDKFYEIIEPIFGKGAVVTDGDVVLRRSGWTYLDFNLSTIQQPGEQAASENGVLIAEKESGIEAGPDPDEEYHLWKEQQALHRRQEKVKLKKKLEEAKARAEHTRSADEDQRRGGSASVNDPQGSSPSDGKGSGSPPAEDSEGATNAVEEAAQTPEGQDAASRLKSALEDDRRRWPSR